MALRRIFLMITMLTLASLACLVSDVKDAVDTVSKAVELLQEIDESGTWTYIGDGLDGIDKANGFAGTIEIIEGATNDTGDTITSVETSIRWSIQTDADDDAAITVIRNDERRDFVVINRGENNVDTYRVTGEGNYECLQSGQTEDDLFATGLDEAFAQYSALAVGVQAISVAEEDGKETINNFSTTRYKLVSKLQEALDILSEFPSEELRQEIADVPEFYINGSLNIDDATKALVGFNAAYADLEKKEGNTFAFEVTELGNQPDISIDESRITVACLAPVSTPAQ